MAPKQPQDVHVIVKQGDHLVIQPPGLVSVKVVARYTKLLVMADHRRHHKGIHVGSQKRRDRCMPERMKGLVRYPPCLLRLRGLDLQIGEQSVERLADMPGIVLSVL